MRYSKNKDYQFFIRQLVSGGEWMFLPKNGRKHSALKHLPTDRKNSDTRLAGTGSAWIAEF